MDSGLNIALDGLNLMIPDFYLSSFTSKNIAPPKAQHVLTRVLFSLIVQGMNVKFDMTTTHKIDFGCQQAPHTQDFLLSISIV